MKVRLYPTGRERELLNRVFGSNRAVYNTMVGMSRLEDDLQSPSHVYNMSRRDLDEIYRPVCQHETLLNYLRATHLETPGRAKQSAYRDFKRAIKSSRSLYWKLRGEGSATTFPQLKFKSLKAKSDSISIQWQRLRVVGNQVQFWPSYLGFRRGSGEGILIKQTLTTNEIEHDMRLQRTRDGKYFLCIPRQRPFEQSTSIRSCAIDPGVRKFITLNDPDGVAFSLNDPGEHIYRRCLEVDRLVSSRSRPMSKRQRHRTQKHLTHLRTKIKNMVKGMHQKVASWLLKNYDQVLLPRFETSRLTARENRLSAATTRKMLGLSHYKFKCLLRYKMVRAGGGMIECGEEYTTKTCTTCGIINRRITSQTVFSCPHCGLQMDRDVNAARNIYLKNEHRLFHRFE